MESAPRRYQVCQFSGKTGNFDFFGPDLLNVGGDLQVTMWVDFQTRRTTFSFSV